MKHKFTTPWIKKNVPGIGMAFVTAFDTLDVSTSNYGNPITEKNATVIVDCSDDKLDELKKHGEYIGVVNE